MGYGTRYKDFEMWFAPGIDTFTRTNIFDLPSIIFNNSEDRYKSKSQIRKNRKDLIMTLEEGERYEFEIGKPRLYYDILTGRKRKTLTTIAIDLWFLFRMRYFKQLPKIIIYIYRWLDYFLVGEFVVHCKSIGVWKTIRLWKTIKKAYD